jgi:hypothetical protein
VSAIDRVLPAWDRRERHSIRIAAPAERVWQACRELRSDDIPLTRALMRVRRGGRRGRGGPILDQFLPLASEPGRELVVGLMGRPWRLRLDAGDFATYAAPGSVRMATDFRIEPDGDGCRLSTETRVQAVDARARRVFGLYWLAIRPGSGLIRRDMLRAVKRRAES